MNSTLKKMLWPFVFIRRAHDAYLRRTKPEKLFSMYYKRIYGKSLNYENPQSFYDKIAYMAFRTDTSEWTRLADKVLVREYLQEKGLGDYLVKQYGTYETSSEIDYGNLPNSFVLKTNNGSATNILVPNKDKLNIIETNKQLDEWLKTDYGYLTCQPHYSRIKPLILAEEYLIDEETTRKGKLLIDYKFYCINGEPRFVQVMTDREPNTHNLRLMLFDMDWHAYPNYVSKIHKPSDVNIRQPISLERMKEAAKILSAGFPFVRVDFYEINGLPKFGEMTFTPGFDTMTIDFFDMIGKEMDISKKRD